MDTEIGRKLLRIPPPIVDFNVGMLSVDILLADLPEIC